MIPRRPGETSGNPSFSSLPWIGLLAVGLLCLTATACAAATGWVHGVTQRLRIANAGRWNLLFGGISLALVIGTVLAGIFAGPAPAGFVNSSPNSPANSAQPRGRANDERPPLPTPLRSCPTDSSF